MRTTFKTLAIASLALPFAYACASDDANGTSASTSGGSTLAAAPSGSETASGSAATGGSTTTAGAQTGTSANTTTTSPQIPALVNVNLSNVLNDLSVRLQIDRANIPVNAQIPIDVAANVCGVSVAALGLSAGGQASCSARTATNELAQVVQQQIAAGGSVGGGAQGGSTATTGGTANTGATTGGATGTGATSSGTTEAQTTTPPQ